MGRDPEKQNRTQPKHPFRQRATVMMFLFGGCYLALVGRLVYLQGIKGKDIREIAIKKRKREFNIVAQRGTILDRNNTVLAANHYQGDLVFDGKAYPVAGADSLQYALDKERYDDSIAFVAKTLGMTPDEVLQGVNESLKIVSGANSVRRAQIIKKDITWEEAQRLRNATRIRKTKRKSGIKEEETPFKLLGFFVQDRNQRTYPMGEDALHVVGMMGAHQDKAHEEFGVMGLEQGLEPILRGSNGTAKAEVDLMLREIPGTKTDAVPVANGLTVHTTIDASIQHVAMKAARNIVEKFDPMGVSIVIMEPDTGDVLAMVSAPTFDPNAEARKHLEYDKDIKPAIKERCATYRVEPGSTFKTLTIASALQNKIIDTNTWFDCAGSLPMGKHSIKCDSHGGSPVHGHQQAIDILRHSCNVGAAKIGLLMKGKLLRESMEQFGLCENLGFPIIAPNYMKVEQGAFTTKKGPLSVPDTARVAFGHAVVTTPVHVASAYAAIANGGILMKPRLITQMTDSEGHVRVENKVEAKRRVLSPEVASQVSEMLRAVVTNGTGRKTAIAGYQLAGKTGTARKYTSKHGLPYVSSFCGFVSAAPNERVRAVVLVLVDEPNKSYYGAEVAVPAFQQIAQDLLRDVWHAKEDDPQSTQLQLAQKSLADEARAHSRPSSKKSPRAREVAQRDESGTPAPRRSRRQ